MLVWWEQLRRSWCLKWRLHEVTNKSTHYHSLICVAATGWLVFAGAAEVVDIIAKCGVLRLLRKERIDGLRELIPLGKKRAHSIYRSTAMTERPILSRLLPIIMNNRSWIHRRWRKWRSSIFGRGGQHTLIDAQALKVVHQANYLTILMLTIWVTDYCFVIYLFMYVCI